MPLDDLTPAQIQGIKANLHKLPVHEQAETLTLLEELIDRRNALAAQTSLLAFAHRVAPVLQMETEPKVFMVGPHHRQLATLMDAVARGEKRRILISVAPRMGKSLMSSYLFPAWYMGKFPNRRIIMASHTADMATGFGRKVRDLISTPEYRTIFPDVELKADSKAAGQWSTNAGGEYFACGTGSALAGRGCNICVIDDPFSEQAAISGNTDVFDDAWTWFQSGPLQRMSPDGAIVIIHTRWARGDLIGRLINQMAKNPDTEQWDVVEFPAIMNEGTENEKSLWPERWPLESLLQKKAVMAPYLWSAQYMQNPTGEAGALIKREWWKNWEKAEPPDCEYVIITLDAAQEAHNRADFNAFQAWGVFYDEREKANIIMLDAWQKRMEYPELKKAMMREYEKWEPDCCLLEKKSSGSVLFQEMRHAGIPVSEFTPGKGQDKIARVNSVSDIFESGLVWAPLDRRWAQEVVEQCSDFPNGDHDDACFIAGTMVLMGDGTSRCIEKVVVGDEVMTPFGIFPVSAAGYTGVRPVWTGAGLTGTGNHPIATTDGWIQLAALNLNSCIMKASIKGRSSWHVKIQMLYQRMWCSMENLTTGIQRVLTPRIGAISCERGVESCSIEPCGSFTMGRYPQTTTYTTRTATTKTTALRTWSAYLLKRIEPSTWKLCELLARGPDSWRTWPLSGGKLLSGIGVRWAARGTGNTHSIISTSSERPKQLKTTIECVRYVTRLLYLTASKLMYAPHSAITFGIRSQGNQKSNVSAAIAARVLHLNLPPEVRHTAHNSVKIEVHQLKEPPKELTVAQEVYNLTVSGVSCFVANGVLVHNCDAMTLALRRFRTGGFIKLSTDPKEEEATYRKNRHYY